MSAIAPVAFMLVELSVVIAVAALLFNVAVGIDCRLRMNR
jgi:hypothetical protein